MRQLHQRGQEIKDESDLLEELMLLRNAGAKTFCLTEGQARMVISLLYKRKQIEQAAQIARKYLKK